MQFWLNSNSLSIKKLFNTSFSSSDLYLSEYIIVNLDNTASDNLFCSPKEHVANILKFSPKLENSLFPSFVKVSWISSFKVKLCFPENNSLKRSSTTVGKFDKY